MTTVEIILLVLTTFSLVSSIFVLKTRGRSSSLLTTPQKIEIEENLTAEFKQKIEFLEKELKQYRRPSTGVTIRWSAPREDKSSYLLKLNNDLPDAIHNVSVSIEEQYKECATIHSKADSCPSQKSLSIFLLPGIWANNSSEPTTARSKFIDIWLENKLKPIKITVKYTKSPDFTDSVQILEAYFTKDNLTNHFKSAIQSSKTRLTLVSVPKKS